MKYTAAFILFASLAAAAPLAEYFKEPEVAVSIVEFRSQPVSIIGAVKNPSVHQLQGRKTLVEILSMAGGLSDDAGHSIKITRRHEWGPIPLKSAQDDLTGKFSLADVDLKAIREARNPEENIIICPQDVISVPRADMIYAIGQVQRSGGFVLKERETISVLQALSLAGGLDRAASPQKARILRPAAGTAARDEIPVNVRKIMSGQLSDVPLKSEDIHALLNGNGRPSESPLLNPVAHRFASVYARLQAIESRLEKIEGNQNGH